MSSRVKLWEGTGGDNPEVACNSSQDRYTYPSHSEAQTHSDRSRVHGLTCAYRHFRMSAAFGPQYGQTRSSTIEETGGFKPASPAMSLY